MIVLIDFIFFDYAFSFFGDPIFIIMAVITYWLGLEGFARRNNLAFKKVEILSEKERSQLMEIADKITSIMVDEKLYTNQNLSVAALSEAIHVKSYLVTKTLTSIFNKKFNDYINELRFEELKSLILDSENEKFTLLGLAFEAGFNSKASFNRTVKKLTGKSPKHLKP